MDCLRLHRQRKHKGRNGASPSVSSINQSDPEHLQVVSQISAISSASQSNESPAQVHQSQPKPDTGHSSIKVSHHIFSSGEWRRARFINHPTMEFTLSVRKRDYKSFSVKCPQVQPVKIKANLDSCAQSCLWSLSNFFKAGFYKDDLISVSFALSAAIRSRIEIVGALLVRLEGVNRPEDIMCNHGLCES